MKFNFITDSFVLASVAGGIAAGLKAWIHGKSIVISMAHSAIGYLAATYLTDYFNSFLPQIDRLGMAFIVGSLAVTVVDIAVIYVSKINPKP
jgi:tryptophan-rich sensory protein